MPALLQTDSVLSVLLVVDEANRESRIRIGDKLKLRGARLRLITIYNEWEPPGETPVLGAPPLERDEITRIIEIRNFYCPKRSS
jgi:hypothetical protein